MRVIIGLIASLIFAVSGFAQNPLLGKNDPFVGTFIGEPGTLEIRKATEGYEGTLSVGAEKFPFKAAKKGEGIEGKISIAGEQYVFVAAVRGDELVVETEGEKLTFKRVKNEREEAAGGEPKKDGKNPYDGWKVIRHPIGISMRYPSSRQMREAEGMYQLVPPGTTDTEEIILVGGEPAAGVKNVEDPQVLAGADMLIAENISPVFKRKGKFEKAKAGNSAGIALLYEGQGPNGTLHVRMYITILKDTFVGITAIMTPDRLAKREPELKKMFASLVAGQAELDKNLVGTWQKYTETTLDAQSSGGRRAGDASSVGNYVTTVVLNADGTFQMRVQGHTIASGSGVFVEGKSDDRYQGTWVAADGKLVLMWEDGNEEYSYKVVNEGGVRQVVLRTGTKEIVYRLAG